MTEGIYDKAEYKKALAWVKEKRRPDFDKNPVEMQKTPAQKEKDWEFTAKMACIIKDLFNGNKKLPKGGEEEMVGHNATSRDKDNGRIFTRTATSPKVFLTLRSTGTGRENLTFSARKTTHSTQRACCL